MVTGLIDTTGLAIDLRHPGGRLFWTDSKAGKVQCSALDGSKVCDVATGIEEPWGIAIGPTHIFWTDRRRGAIQSCCLRTGSVCDVLTDVPSPEGLAVLNVRVPVGGRPSGAGPAVVQEPLRRPPATVLRTPKAVSGRRTRRPPSIAPASAGARQLASAAALYNQQRQLRVERTVLSYTSQPDELAPRRARSKSAAVSRSVATQASRTPSVQDLMRLSADALKEIEHEFHV